MEIVFLLLLATCLGYSDAECNVVPITEWAGEPSRRVEILKNPVGLVIIQHTATEEFSTDEECATAVRGIRRYHMDFMNFNDVGQSFFICGNGKVYEGAGWGLVGAHTRNYNSISIGVSFIGNFASKLPTPKALNAAIDLLNCGVEQSHLVKDYQVVGHRQVTNTLSPGDRLQNEIENWPHWVSGKGRY